VAGGEITDVQGDSTEPLDLHRLPLLEKPVGDAALIEHLDGARVQTAGARAVGIRSGASFDDDDVDARQRQLSRQHHPRRTSSSDHHRMLGHTPPLSFSVGSRFGRKVWSTTRVLPQAPGALIY
jgi:hypothetical protein